MSGTSGVTLCARTKWGCSTRLGASAYRGPTPKLERGRLRDDHRQRDLPALTQIRIRDLANIQFATNGRVDAKRRIQAEVDAPQQVRGCGTTPAPAHVRMGAPPPDASVNREHGNAGRISSQVSVAGMPRGSRTINWFPVTLQGEGRGRRNTSTNFVTCSSGRASALFDCRLDHRI
jgi:hypothetical protein